MMDENRVIMVAGTISLLPWKLPDPNQKNEKIDALSELISYIKCFLEGHVYPGNSRKATDVAEKILIRSSITDDAITFQFEADITNQFNLPETFTMQLKKGAAFGFYIDELLPKARLSCTILIDEDDEFQKKRTFVRLQNIVLQSAQQIKRIQIRKSERDRHIIAISFHQRGVKRILLTADTLTDAVYRIQESLL